MAELLAANQITIAKVLDGETGADGYSPTVTTGTSSDGSTTVTVTNKDGSNTTTLVDGKARTDIDNLEIGGRNLVKRENIIALNTSFSKIDGYEYTQLVGNSAGIKFPEGMFTEDTEYVLSFKFQKVSGTLTSIAGHSTAFETRNVVINGESFSQDWTTTHEIEDSEAIQTCVVYLRRYTASENSGTDNNLYIQPERSRYHTSNDITIKYWDIKIEKGNKATDWTPAPEDVQAEIDNIEIGGRNLVWDTEWKNISARWTNWGSPTTREIVTLNGKRWLHIVTTTTKYQGYSQGQEKRAGYGEIKAGDKIIVSCSAYAITAGQKCNVGLHWINSSGSIVSQNWADFTLTTTEKKYVSAVFTVPNGAVGFNVMVGDSTSAAQELWISEVKLELGNKATDWTPAPEDVEAGIDNAAKVATNFINYDSTNGLVLGNKESGSWVGYRTQILSDRFNVLDASSTVLASFGPTTVIGEEANANMHLTFNNLSMVDKNGTKFFEVGDNRNADGIATVKHTETISVDSTGSATVTVNSNIWSIVSVYADSVQLSSSSYSFSEKTVTINGLTADSEKTIEITYTTTESTVYLTFGERDSSGNIGNYSVAEGYNVISSGYCSHAEGYTTTASGWASHAEGGNTTASEYRSHAEGYTTTASGWASHAEGGNTTASEYCSHAEGRRTTASGYCSHAEGFSTTASVDCSHAGGLGTVADGEAMTAIGKYNTENSGKAFVVGIGDVPNRRDGFTVDWNGNATMKGGLTLGKALSIANGGTGATTAAAACKNLGAVVAEDTGWVNLTTKKGTWDYCQYRYKNGIVYIRGYATAYAWGGSTGEFFVANGTIPSQYRPPVVVDLTVRCAGTRWGQIVVTASGGIYVDRILNGTTSYTSSSWFRFNVSYPI